MVIIIYSNGREARVLGFRTQHLGFRVWGLATSMENQLGKIENCMETGVKKNQLEVARS